MITKETKNILSFRKALRDYSNSLAGVPDNLQTVHTPFDLCRGIVDKTVTYTSLDGFTFCCLNMEWVEVLLVEFGVPADRVWFVTDCAQKAKAIGGFPRYNGVHTVVTDFVQWRTEMKFDCMMMNPPYQGKIKERKDEEEYQGSSDARNNNLWPDFVTKALSLCKDNGFCAFIHPPRWRKPEDSTWDELVKYQIEYLEIHNKKDGDKTFGATTRYDWYILRKKPCEGKTTIVDELGVRQDVDLRQLHFLPNYHLDTIGKILAGEGEEKLTVLYSTPYHHQNAKRMRPEAGGDFQYPCVHGLRADGEMTLWYSNANDQGHFRVKKVILNDGETLYPLIDTEGKYGMTEGPFAIVVDYDQEAIGIKTAVETEGFREIVRACKWSSFRTDYRMFKYFMLACQ